MKTYGTIMAFTPTINNVQLGNVVDQEFNQVYKTIHSFKVQEPKTLEPRATPQPLKTQTQSEKNEELRDLMDLYYKVKINEYTAQGAIQPAFKPSPYSNEFNFIHSTSLDTKRAKLLAVEEWKSRTGREFKPKARMKTETPTGAIQQAQQQMTTQTVSASTTKRREQPQSPGRSSTKRTVATPSLVSSQSIGTNPQQVPAQAIDRAFKGTTATPEKQKIINQAMKKEPQDPLVRRRSWLRKSTKKDDL